MELRDIDGRGRAVAHVLPANGFAGTPDALPGFVRLPAGMCRNGSFGDDYDSRLLARVERQSVKARTISWSSRLRPLYKAAAVVAILLTLGTAIQHAIQGEDSAAVADYNYATYSDTYNDPQVALEEASSALERISEGLRATMAADSLQALQQTVGTKLTE